MKICDVFADKYCKLYNSVPVDKNIMAMNIRNECLSKKCYSLYVIEVSDVIDSMEKLKARKSDSINNLVLRCFY